MTIIACSIIPGAILVFVLPNLRIESENFINMESGTTQSTFSIPNQCKMFQQKYPLGV